VLQVGKSTLLNKLTDTYSTVADYAFTTLEAVPGVIKYNGARIQLLDLPGIIEGAKDGKGRGKQVIGTARTCDLMMMVLDSGKPITHKQHIEKELEGFGIRLNKEPPNISFKRKEKGGINYTYSVTDPKNCPSLATVQQICKEYKVPNADIVMKGDYSEEDLIDVLEGNRVYMLCIYAMNKIDNLTLEELEILDSLPHYVPISSEREWNLDGLLEKMWDYLNFNRGC
jgi:small GTP-binding protein